MGSSTGGSGPRPSPLQIIRRQIKLPYTDLGLTDRSDRPMELASEWGLSLVLPFGIGPNEPRLLAVDDAGRLITTGDLNNGGFQTLIDDPTQSVLKARVLSATDARQNDVGLRVSAMNGLFNGATWDRNRSASAAGMGARSGLGVGLVAQPGLWSVISNPVAGTQASSTRAAGGAGIVHVAHSLIITFGAIAAPVATSLVWNLRDGASGAGAVLAQGQVAVPAAPFATVTAFIGPLSVPGTANTAMTLEFSGGLANLLEGTTLLGFDAS